MVRTFLSVLDRILRFHHGGWIQQTSEDRTRTRLPHQKSELQDFEKNLFHYWKSLQGWLPN